MEWVIGSLFETLSEPDWASAFLAGVCSETQSHAAAVLHVDVGTRRQTLPAFFGQGQAMAEAFEQTHASENPWRPADESRGPAVGSVVVPDDVLPLARLRKTGFWNDFLRPMDADHAAGVIGLRAADRVLSITLLRSARQGAYGAEERAWLSRVAPHWVNACSLRSRLFPPDGSAWNAAHALDRMATAVFFLDDLGRCVRWNAAADEKLRDGSLVRLRGGRLVAASPGQGSIFPDGTGPTVLRRKDGTAAGHAASHRLPGHGALGSARAVVFIAPVEATHPRALRQALVAVYGLTPREAEVAERLAAGSGLKEVAAAMGVSAEGARTRIKVVYGKTGAKHQAALVALVRSLNAVLGQNTTDV